MRELGIITIKGCIKEFVDEQSANGTIKHLWYQDPLTLTEFSAIPISKNPEESIRLYLENKYNQVISIVDNNDTIDNKLKNIEIIISQVTRRAVWKYEEIGENKIAVSPSILQHDVKNPDDSMFREGFHSGIPTYFDLMNWEDLKKLVWGDKETM